MSVFLVGAAWFADWTQDEYDNYRSAGRNQSFYHPARLPGSGRGGLDPRYLQSMTLDLMRSGRSYDSAASTVLADFSLMAGTDSEDERRLERDISASKALNNPLSNMSLGTNSTGIRGVTDIKSTGLASSLMDTDTSSSSSSLGLAGR